MRIRSIKPDFWRSSDVSCLAIEDRLLFIGLWSYVDDNGVGLDRLSLVTADLFADDLERESPETLARVSRGLSKLFSTGLIHRYQAENRALLYVVNWDKHQRVDKPNKERYPKPNLPLTRDSGETRENPARIPRDTRETLAPGAGEQGNRGTGDKDSSSPNGDGGFDSFWQLYPKKVGKQATRRKWDTTVKRVAPDVIMGGLRRYVAWWEATQTDKQYIPGPDVWLNKGRWADELDDPEPASWYPA